MKNIKKIFLSDISALIRNFYVLIIAAGLCLLPALYAWFNIYSNWDPYGNTNQIKIAAASNDIGYTDTNGTKTIVGDSILENLKKNTSINWIITSAKQAKQGVYSGDYYAAVILPKNFSECMYDGFMQGLKQPQVTYYVNDKKNSVATKITDTAVSNVQNSINEMYISILVSNVFEKENKTVTKINEQNTLSTLQDKVNNISDNLTGYSNTIRSLSDANKKLSGSIDNAISDLQTLKNTTSKNNISTTSLMDNLMSRNQIISSSLSSATLHINKVQTITAPSNKITHYEKALSELQKAQTQLNNILSAFSDLPKDTSLQTKNKELIATLQQQITSITSLEKQLRQEISDAKLLKNKASDKTKTALEKLEEKSRKAASLLESTFQNTVLPLTQEIAQLADTLQKDISNATENLTEDIDLLKQLLTGTKSSLSSADKGLTSLSDVLQQAAKELSNINTTLSSLTESEWLAQALSFMEGDPEGYGEFFASPIKIKTEQIYPVENYGSGVTPFYTTLAIWVGGIFLVSMIKVTPNTKKFPDAKPHELFCGRFLLFLLLGQIQTLVIVIGNLSLLHTQCLYPRHFWFACAIASLTFLLLIYAFTVSFGDVGKALIVVFVVIQIAGSSGTYPIEILPEFYQKIYIFFPFPYAIDAMREAICGLNGNDYFIYLFQLLLFAAAALLLGLVIRLPFRKLNHFVEKRMEDTEMM